jgi:ferredoxin
MSEVFLKKAELQALILAVRSMGYTVIGPTVDQGAIVYGEVETAAALPLGWTDQQAPGQYRLHSSGQESYFAYNVGPHSWKQFLFPPRVTLGSADRTGSGWKMSLAESAPLRYAFLGVRACELAALEVQDRVFLNGPYTDPVYQQRRSNAFIVAVNCTQAASTCFCTSMNTGPRCRQAFDLALTELETGFVVESGSPSGAELLSQLTHRPATPEESTQAGDARQRAVDQITRTINTDGIRDLLLGNLDHPRWDQVSGRCLSCANCTMVCPTCFCSTVSEVTDLQGDHVDRVRTWDSCFNIDFSYTAGGVVRNDRRSRYRQWLTHKLASWHDQFDTSGCTGCGRCITWCPVGIDLTEEVEAIRSQPPAGRTLPIVPAAAATVCHVDKEKS